MKENKRESYCGQRNQNHKGCSNPLSEIPLPSHEAPVVWCVLQQLEDGKGWHPKPESHWAPNVIDYSQDINFLDAFENLNRRFEVDGNYPWLISLFHQSGCHWLWNLGLDSLAGFGAKFEIMEHWPYKRKKLFTTDVMKKTVYLRLPSNISCVAHHLSYSHLWGDHFGKYWIGHQWTMGKICKIFQGQEV